MPRRRQWEGVLAAIAFTALLAGVMLPFRAHLAIATVALVLVVPVVLAVVVGGYLPGLVAVAVGFLTYDIAFIPPYGTLTVGRVQNWWPLVVYVVVMAAVSHVVGQLWRTDAASRESAADIARLFELSELLVADRPPDELYQVVVGSVVDAFGVAGAALFLPRERADGSDAGLIEAAHAGRELTEDEREAILPSAGNRASLRPMIVRSSRPAPAGNREQVVEAVVLAVAARPVGLLGIVGAPLPRRHRELLTAYANHLALAIERAHLRDQAVRVQILEEVDRHRRSLLRAVSHDLRTPLATIKASATALLDSSLALGEADRAELSELIEAQSDRLGRVVSNLLDLSRIHAGALVPDQETMTAPELFSALAEALGPAASGVAFDSDSATPPLSADRTLLVEALVNLVENALRFVPAGDVVRVDAAPSPAFAGGVRLAVTDGGPGIAPEDRARVFELFEQAGGPATRSGGTGLGLSIARAFVEAHGGRLGLDPAHERGTRMVVDMPAAAVKMDAPAPAGTAAP